METPLGAAHDEGAGVQQRLFGRQSWQNCTETADQAPGLGSSTGWQPGQSWGGETMGVPVQKGPRAERELQTQLRRLPEGRPERGRWGSQT